MSVEIVGREEELRSMRAFFERASEGPAALILEGGAGMGKSTLWLLGVDEARKRGFRVLRSRPAEAERGLAFAGLGDLFEDVLDEIVSRLPSPRRRALEAALLVIETDESVDPRALGVAVRNALEILAADERLVVAVDDVQWFDRSSESALSFALRRVDDPVVLMLTRRIAEGIEPSRIEQALAPDSVQRLRVGPLSVGAIQRLLQDRLDRIFARPTLLRVYELSDGNPFYALELARALGPDVDPTQPLPIPETLEGLVRARVTGLPTSTQKALALASALGRPSHELLRTAGVEDDALDPALATRVIEVVGGDIRFTHPLLASAVYQGLSVGERRRLHRTLAEYVGDPVERARHLALSAHKPDRDITASLEEAAEVAMGRGAVATAVELREHALRLTPAESRNDVHRRTVAVARAHLATGNPRRAAALIRDLLDRAPAGALRAEAFMLASELESGVGARLALLRKALDEASEDLALQARIHRWLGREARFSEGLDLAERHAQASLAIAESLNDVELLAGALSTVATMHLHLGVPDAVELAERAHELAATAGDPQVLAEVTLSVSSTFAWTGRLDRARALLEAFYAEWKDFDEQAVQQALWRLGLVELEAGRFARAADYAGRARQISLQYAIEEGEDAAPLHAVSVIAAHRGELALARELARRGLAEGERNPWFVAYHEAVLGQVAHFDGDELGAVERFVAAEQTRDVIGSLEPAIAGWRGDHIEALLELGRIEEAVGLLGEWETDAARLGRDRVLAQAMRCRGLAAASRGDVDEALLDLERAVEEHGAAGDPFGRARALLALGVVRRRAHQKRPAREAIEEAVAVFEECGAAGWAEKARAELGRIGGRTREEGLTPAEQRVAALVVEGRTNREVAAALFLGERTVETHLSHIYAKLGVRSRTELTRQLRSSSGST
jgi:DNA-binding CsgD family transcriptional regulator